MPTETEITTHICSMCKKIKNIKQDFYVLRRKDGTIRPITLETMVACRKCCCDRVAANYHRRKAAAQANQYES
jgi:hypothetical protein